MRLRGPIGTSACAISWRSAAIRPNGAPNSSRIRAATATPPSWSQASNASRRSKFRSRPFPNAIRNRPSEAADLDNLRRKIDAGADRAITQFFFDPQCFFRYRDKVAAAGIDIEILPGIMPVTNFAAVSRMAAMNGTAVPDWVGHLFEGLDDLPSARQLVAATVAAELCGQLYAGGVRHFHFYTLNRAELAYAICHLLGMRAVA